MPAWRRTGLYGDYDWIQSPQMITPHGGPYEGSARIVPRSFFRPPGSGYQTEESQPSAKPNKNMPVATDPWGNLINDGSFNQAAQQEALEAEYKRELYSRLMPQRGLSPEQTEEAARATALQFGMQPPGRSGLPEFIKSGSDVLRPTMDGGVEVVHRGGTGFDERLQMEKYRDLMRQRNAILSTPGLLRKPEDEQKAVALESAIREMEAQLMPQPSAAPTMSPPGAASFGSAFDRGVSSVMGTNQTSFAPTTTTAGGTPVIGEVRKGYRYLGGNPASRSSWEKVQ